MGTTILRGSGREKMMRSNEFALLVSAVRKLAEEVKELREELPAFAAGVGEILGDYDRQIALLEEIVADHEAHLVGRGKPEFPN